jgi:hypothetical protein
MEAHIEMNDFPILEGEADSASEYGTPGDNLPGENGVSKKRRAATHAKLVKTGKKLVEELDDEKEFCVILTSMC